jgi:hypothetical protein
MPKIKVILEKGETAFEADNLLFKALNSHNTGELHEGDAFDDPAMQDLINRVEAEHAKMFKEMMSEINDALDEEYHNGYI